MLILPYDIGMKVVIRTDSYHYIGTINDSIVGWVKLKPACWLADSGRWSEFLRSGPSHRSELEPYPGECWIPTHRILDVSTWDFDIPVEAQ